MLDAGRLVEVGTHDELIRLGANYARLYALQNLDTIEFSDPPEKTGST